MEKKNKNKYRDIIWFLICLRNEIIYRTHSNLIVNCSFFETITVKSLVDVDNVGFFCWQLTRCAKNIFEIYLGENEILWGMKIQFKKNTYELTTMQWSAVK